MVAGYSGARSRDGECGQVKMTPEERKAYVRGVVAVCTELKIQEHVVAKVCRTLKIAPDELTTLCSELAEEMVKK